MDKKYKTCLICNSDKIDNVRGYEFAFLAKCQTCNFVFCNRKPSQEELIKHYDGYRRNNSVSSIVIKRYNELLDKFEKFRLNNNILDIGCGDGYFLIEAKKRGWNVYGTEYTAEAFNICLKKNIIMHQGKLDMINYPNIYFDIVTLFEVIEHINNPVEEILTINSILRKGGVLYCTTPNFNSISRNILKQNWSIIEYPEHLSYYTNKSINYLLTKNGFSKINLRTTGVDLTKRHEYKSIELIERFDKNKLIEDIDRNLILTNIKHIANKLLSFVGKGDTIKALYQKNN